MHRKPVSLTQVVNRDQHHSIENHIALEPHREPHDAPSGLFGGQSEWEVGIREVPHAICVAKPDRLDKGGGVEHASAAGEGGGRGAYSRDNGYGPLRSGLLAQ